MAELAAEPRKVFTAFLRTIDGFQPESAESARWHGRCSARFVESVAGLSPSSSTRERRAHRRVKLAARALLLDEGVETYGSCVDLSMGGSGLLARGQRVGSTIRLGIELEPGVWVHTNAEIVRAHEDFVGVRFVQLPQRALTAILSRVAQG